MWRYLLNYMRYARSCECQVLESTGKVAVVCRVRKGCSRGRGELGKGVNRSSGRVAGLHTRTLNDLQGVLLLRKKQTIGGWSDSDAKEEMKGAHVFHSKFALQ